MLGVYMETNFSKLDLSAQGLVIISLIAMIIIRPALELLLLSHTKLINKVEE